MKHLATRFKRLSLLYVNSISCFSFKKSMSFTDKCLMLLSRILKPGFLTSYILHLLKQKNNQKGDYYCCFHFTTNNRSYFKLEDFRGNSTGMFENIRITIPLNFDSILKKLYGDYMKIPDPAHQISNHNFKAFYVNQK